jgi:hypothetical protein
MSCGDPSGNILTKTTIMFSLSRKFSTHTTSSVEVTNAWY